MEEMFFFFSFFLGAAVFPSCCGQISLTKYRGLGKWVLICALENASSIDIEKHINRSNLD